MWKSLTSFALAIVCLAPSVVCADEITVRITNLQPRRGLYLTPLLFTTHDGTWAPFTIGRPAPRSIEWVAEDGIVVPLMEEALASGVAAQSLATPGGPIAPWQTRTVTLNVSMKDPTTQFLSFITMVIPSNDAFLANVNPRAIPLWDENGIIERVGFEGFFVLGDEVLDAGTEVNDEVPEHTAFLAQMTPNTGEDEGGVVEQHWGFQGSQRLGGRRGNILLNFPRGDFTRQFVPMLVIEVLAKE